MFKIRVMPNKLSLGISCQNALIVLSADGLFDASVLLELQLLFGREFLAPSSSRSIRRFIPTSVNLLPRRVAIRCVGSMASSIPSLADQVLVLYSLRIDTDDEVDRQASICRDPLHIDLLLQDSLQSGCPEGLRPEFTEATALVVNASAVAAAAAPKMLKCHRGTLLRRSE